MRVSLLTSFGRAATVLSDDDEQAECAMRRRTVLQGFVALAAVTRGLSGSAQTARTQLVLLGTQGGPNFNLLRGESASVLVIDERLYLVDCGYGTLGALVRAGLRYTSVDQVFLTHLHDDHAADLPSLLGHQWTDGRVTPVGVYGPAGTERLVAAALDFNTINEEIRLVDEARSVRLRELFSGTDVGAGDEPVEVFADERLTITAVENTHYPDESKTRMSHRSVSYRCTSRDRIIVFSGDTTVSPALVRLARGADVLVCEAMEVELMRAAFDARVANGAYADNPEGIWHHIVTTHTTTEQAGEMAAAAGVKTLVLTHLIPGALAPQVTDEVYGAGARRHFDGEIVVGRDLLVL
jgi:ribonuclease BN (tRNA processing enzyme)